jgi:hypothetical protein
MQRFWISIPCVITSAILLSFCLVDPASAKSRNVGANSYTRVCAKWCWVDEDLIRHCEWHCTEYRGEVDSMYQRRFRRK